ncbi:hypothetical protein EDD21DRAFT_353476 [Dissophora ornata]|nr:hypothetical protein EDD21DRAFT_353476 [Dissophora ornata]
MFIVPLSLCIHFLESIPHLPMISIFDLPHVLEGIRDGLAPKDVASCALVCHSWSLIFGPFSWRAFVLKEKDYAKLLSEQSTRKLFDTRVHTIEDLTIIAHQALRPFETHFRNHPELLQNQLTRISLSGDCRHTSQFNDETTETVLQLIERNEAQLVHVEVWVAELPDRFVDRLTIVFPRMKALRTLSLRGDKSISIRDLNVILRNYPPQVESLEIDYTLTGYKLQVRQWNLYGILDDQDWVGYHDTTDDWPLLAWYWSGAPQSNIRRLVLPKCSEYPEGTCPGVLLFLKHRCHKMVEFKLPAMNPVPRPKDVATALGRCPKIRHLEFEGIAREMLPIYPSAIRACHALESLTVSGSVFDARDVMKAIVDTHASTIKKIRWTGGGGFTGGLDLEEFLRSCPNLERLETSYGDMNSFTGQGAVGSLWIRDQPVPSFVASLPPSSIPPPNPVYWACQSSLTYLDVLFCPDRKSLKMQQLREQVEFTYIKLGQLHVLEELHLGCDCRCVRQQLSFCTHSQWNRTYGAPEVVNLPKPSKTLTGGQSSVSEGNQDTNNANREIAWKDKDAILDMSLATGLAHLSELKKLQVLNISRIKGHKIGSPELMWMKANWPQLEKFDGLRNPTLWEWVYTNWPSLLK